MPGTKAITYANCGVANANLDFTYREEGLDGNAVGIEYLDPAAASSALSFSYASGKVSVSLATNGSSVITTIASDISTAINGVKAACTLTSDNTELADGATVTIGGVTYRFKDTMAQAYDVQRDGTTADTTLGYLVKAINGTGTPGTEYFAGTLAHSLVSAANVSGHATVVTARHPGTNVNTTPTTETSSHLSWAATTLGGGTAGVEPTAGNAIHTLFTLANHAANDGTGTVAAMSVKFPSSSGGTAGVGTAYDSATTMMAAGWIVPDNAVGAVVIANAHSSLAAQATITQYEAFVYLDDGGKKSVVCDTAAHLLTGTKSFAIQMASQSKARKWSPRAWYSPALYAR